MSLSSLTHHAGVNALAPNQTIHFASQLTVVYGPNAAGKSGYTRILKRACRARGAEEILGNVIADSAPRPPSATINYTVAGQNRDHPWNDQLPVNSALATISVFDRHCASVYVAERTDVAFRPLGLDLFDKLSAACQAVRKILEKEQQQLALKTLHLPSFPTGTAVHTSLANLTPLTDSVDIKGLASLTDVDKARTVQLNTRLHDLQSRDPNKIVRALQLRADRARTLLARLVSMGNACSDAAIQELLSARARRDHQRRTFTAEQATAFHDQPLDDTGSEAWNELWIAAKRYSTTGAYAQHRFPYVAAGSRCVLCQQPLAAEAADRLRQFSDFLTSDVQRDYDRTDDAYSASVDALNEAVLADDPPDAGLADLDVHSPELAERVRSYLLTVTRRVELATEALGETPPTIPILPALPDVCRPIERHIDELESRVEELRHTDHEELIDRIQNELSELRARQVLADNLDAVLDEIERKKKLAVYQVCLVDTRTTAITNKSVEITKRTVTDQLVESFDRELNELGFRDVEVRLVPSGGSRGALYHKLQLRRAPSAALARVVSEGESRCLSLASFFAELTTGEHRSAILFDDPVSSLDHTWRRNVAKRLVFESQSRQVIVFTHDIVFLLELQSRAEEAGVELKNQYLRRDREGAGRSSERLPWVAMRVRERIGHLRSLHQDVAKVYREGAPEEYEKDAIYIYGLLREAWERGVEQVLLGGTVERFRNSVQTKSARYLADILPADISVLDAAMTKASTWLPGHDQSAAVNAPVPEPDEIADDIRTLDDWVSRINKRRP